MDVAHKPESTTMLASTCTLTAPKRRFAQFPMKRTWREIRENVVNLPGAAVILFIATDYDTWLVFEYDGHEFSINDHDAVLSFQVQDRDCPPQVLSRVTAHFSWLSARSQSSWMAIESEKGAASFTQRDKKAAILACRPRFFAELPFCKPWSVICDRILSLEGTQQTTFATNEPETWMGFAYKGEQFRLHDRGATLHISVEDATCPDALILEVLRHFTDLLTADTWEMVESNYIPSLAAVGE